MEPTPKMIEEAVGVLVRMGATHTWHEVAHALLITVLRDVEEPRINAVKTIVKEMEMRRNEDEDSSIIQVDWVKGYQEATNHWRRQLIVALE